MTQLGQGDIRKELGEALRKELPEEVKSSFLVFSTLPTHLRL